MATFTIQKGDKKPTKITASSCEVRDDGKYVFKNADLKVVAEVSGKNVDTLKREDDHSPYKSWLSNGYMPSYYFSGGRI